MKFIINKHCILFEENTTPFTISKEKPKDLTNFFKRVCNYFKRIGDFKALHSSRRTESGKKSQNKRKRIWQTF